MHLKNILLLLPLAVAFTPSVEEPPSKVLARQSAVVTPVPCQGRFPAPSERKTKLLHNEFGYAFLVSKNLTKAFEYISSTYINHNPFADDGPNAALDFLGPVWPTVNITVHRLAFRDNMGWLNYNVTGIGEIVDRFRWENGCIMEHWDVGETYPQNVTSWRFPPGSKGKWSKEGGRS